MNIKDFSDTLSYCLYICDDEVIKNELYEIQTLFVTEFAKETDLNRLKQIETEIQKQFRD